MRELDLDGIHDDGEHLLLVDSDGERYTLRIDKALRAAVRTDRPALNMIQAADAAPLRPREIQAMLRAGRSAEEISETSEIPLEHVRRYEGPVLAEREWTAQRTRSFPVGRGGPALQDVVTERLLAREAAGDTAWDAWRRQDGTWTLELTFSAGGRTRQAHWVADIDNRSVAPVDDEARWISDEDAPPEPRSGRGRLQAVKSSVYDLEADGSLEGAPAPRTRTWPPRLPVSDEHPSVIDDEDLEALNARRGLRTVPRPDDSTTVWSGLEDVDDTETAAIEVGDLADPSTGGADGAAAERSAATGPSAGEDAEDQEHDEDEREHAPAQLDLHGAATGDADLEAEREYSADGALDIADPSSEDPEDGVLEGEGPGDDLGEDSATEGAPEEPNSGSTDSTDEDSASSSEGDPSAPGAASSAQIRYQDTVDLTPLPGFDDAERTPSPSDVTDPSEETPRKPAKKASKARSKRASMPSWDEIVFGSKHD